MRRLLSNYVQDTIKSRLVGLPYSEQIVNELDIVTAKVNE
jgi:hypothetical protein